MPSPLDWLKGIQPPPQPIGTPIPGPLESDQQVSVQQAQDPLWKQYSRTAVNGGIDAILGLVGLGDPTTKANLTGQLISSAAAIPFASLGGIDGVETGIKGLYSRVSRAAQGLPETFHPNRALSAIGNAASQEEMDYRGLSQFLAGKGDQPTTRAEVLQHLSENPPPQVNMRTLGNTGGWTQEHSARLDQLEHMITRTPAQEDAFQSLINQENAVSEPGGQPSITKYSSYTLPGGQNYRENLLTLPSADAHTKAEALRRGGFTVATEPDPETGVVTHWVNDPSGQRAGGYEFGQSTQADPDRALAAHAEFMNDADFRNFDPTWNQQAFHSSHWDDPNVLVHSRTNERTLAAPPPNVPFPTEQPSWPALEQQGYRAEIDADPYSGNQVRVYGPDGNIAYSRGRSQMPAEDMLHEFAVDQGVGQYNQARSTPTGPPGRFIEEVQSDWHQQGAESGYQDPAYQTKLDEARSKLGQAQSALDQNKARLMDQYGYIPDDIDGPPEERDLHNALYTSRINAEDELSSLESWGSSAKRVPDAPFKTSWPDLALKQQVLDVAQRPDLEWLGHTVGQTQADRYDLSQHVSQITYDPGTGTLQAHDNAGNRVIHERGVTPQKLQEFIGKDATTRIMQAPDHILAGEDLQVGGEGMKQFYDRTLPNKLQKIVGPFGGKVEQGQVSGGTSAPLAHSPGHQPSYGPQTTPAWISRLTPEMKAEILKKGLPLMMLMGLTQQPQDQLPQQGR